MIVGWLNGRILFCIYYIGLLKVSKGFKIFVGDRLLLYVLDFKKYVDMIEVEIRCLKEDSIFRISEVNKFINVLIDIMERRFNILIIFLKFGFYYDRIKVILKL